MSPPSFESRLLGDEGNVSRDEQKLQRDETKVSTDEGFAAKLGVGADLRLAENDAGAPAGAPMPGSPQQMPPSVADWGGPQLGPNQAAPSQPVAPPQGPPGQMVSVGGPQGFDRPEMVSVGGAGGFDRPAAPPPMPLAPPPQQMGPPGPNLQGAVNAGNNAILGTYDDQRAHMTQSAQQHGVATGQLSQLHHDEAQRQIVESQRAVEQAEDAKQKNDEYLKKTDEMNTALASGKIDPQRLWHKADTGTKVAMGIAAFLGSIVPGVRPLSNLILGSAEDDIKSQEDEYNRKGAGIRQRDNIYSHMLKASGDSQLAKLQGRNAIIEAQKLEIQSQAERLGMPEALTNAKIAVDSLNRDQAKLQTEIAVRAKATADAQAAAAAAARRHAEEQAWNRTIQLDELDLKHQDADTRRIEAGNKAGEKVGDLDKNYADRILRGKVPEQESAIKSLQAQQARDKNGQVDPHKRIAGLSPFDDFREKLMPTPGGLGNIMMGGPGNIFDRAIGLNSQERVNRNNWDRAKLSYQVEVTGAGGSDKQMAIIDKAFAGAKTPEEQANAIEQKDRMIMELKRAAAQGDQSVIARAERAGGMPASVRMK